MDMTWFHSLQMHEVILYGLVFGVPTLAIGSGVFTTIVKLVIRHRERMAMIEHGLHPDYPPEQFDPPEDRPPEDQPPGDRTAASEQLADTQLYVRE